MFLIIKGGDTTTIYNMDSVSTLWAEDEKGAFTPHKIKLVVDGKEHQFFASSDKFEQQTALAAIIGAIKSGEASLELNNPAGLSIDALKARARSHYTGANFIDTIKHIRQWTGWGLKEAKQFADEHVKGWSREVSEVEYEQQGKWKSSSEPEWKQQQAHRQLEEQKKAYEEALVKQQQLQVQQTLIPDPLPDPVPNPPEEDDE